MSNSDVLKSVNLFKIFTENCRLRYGYKNHYILTDLFSIIYPKNCYSGKFIKSFWKRFLNSSKNKKIINFHLHIPYCVKRCYYCICDSHNLNNFEDLESYIQCLTKSFNYFKKTFLNIEFYDLRIEGGTPSILSQSQLKYLLASLFSSFKFKSDGLKCFELNPINSSFGKLKLLKEYGFNRVSFGVQTFNQKVLTCNNRNYQKKEVVEKSILDAKKLKFEHINIDLLLGLYGDDEECFVESFKQAINLKPTSIAMYPLQPKSDYISKYFNSDNNLFINFRSRLFSQSIYKVKMIARNEGYEVPKIHMKNISIAGSWHFVIKNSKKISRKLKNNFYDNPRDNSVFGLGFYSNSRIYEEIRYQLLFQDKNASKNVARGNILNKKTEMILYILRVLSYKKWIYRKVIISNFSIDMFREFEKIVKNLSVLNLAKIVNNDKIYFYPSNPRERFLYSLFFFDKNDVIKCMNSYLIKNLIRIIINNNIFDFRIAYSNGRKNTFFSFDIYSLVLLHGCILKDAIIINFLNKIKEIFKKTIEKHSGFSAEEIRNVFFRNILLYAHELKNKPGISNFNIAFKK